MVRPAVPVVTWRSSLAGALEGDPGDHETDRGSPLGGWRLGASMAEKIRVGIVGATVTPGGSGWGANAHVPALHALPDFELKAVCTAHEETAKASAAAFGAELAFHDFDQMVTRPDVDLVAVVVRLPGQHSLVVRAP